MGSASRSSLLSLPLLLLLLIAALSSSASSSEAPPTSSPAPSTEAPPTSSSAPSTFTFVPTTFQDRLDDEDFYARSPALATEVPPPKARCVHGDQTPLMKSKILGWIPDPFHDRDPVEREDRENFIPGLLDKDMHYFRLRSGENYEEEDDSTLNHHQRELLRADLADNGRHIKLTLAFSRYYFALTNLRDARTQHLAARLFYTQLAYMRCASWNMDIRPLGSLPSCRAFANPRDYHSPSLPEADPTDEHITRLRLPLIAMITLVDHMREGGVRVSLNLSEAVANDKKVTAEELKKTRPFDYGHPYKKEFSHYEKMLYDKDRNLNTGFIERAARFLDRLKWMSKSNLTTWLDRFEAAEEPKSSWQKIKDFFSSG